jgi:hypothetical protein
MKKYIILVFTLVLIFVLGFTTQASQIPVGVERGLSFELTKVFTTPATDEIIVKGNYGLNDHLLLSLGYGTSSQTWIFAGRNAFSKNTAIIWEYKKATVGASEANTILFGGRFKLNLSDQLDIVGEANYSYYSFTISHAAVSSINSSLIKCQGEYKLSDMLVLNGGASYASAEGVTGTTIIVGAELQPIKQFKAGLDYSMPSTGDQGMITLVLSYTL